MQGSASGIDGLFAKDLLLCPPAGFACFLNVILAIGHLPTQHCFSRSALIPKVQRPHLPSEYRPIAVSNIIPRLLNRITADSWSRLCPPPTSSLVSRSEMERQRRRLHFMECYGMRSLLQDPLLWPCKMLRRPLMP
ncbi:hypothetical protein AAHC03_026806 [Spirometra sp. Aus1]